MQIPLQSIHVLVTQKYCSECVSTLQGSELQLRKCEFLVLFACAAA